MKVKSLVLLIPGIIRKDKMLIILSLSIVLFLFSYCKNGNQKSTHFYIGLSEVNYDPPVGSDLVGNYRGDDYASKGFHDSLYARAFVIEDNENQKVAFLSIDICKLPKESVVMMRNYIAANTDIKAENVLINATHTHSGPRSELDAPHAGEYLKKAASAVILANQRLKSGNIYAGKTDVPNIAFNRRLSYMDGKTHMSWEQLDPDSVISTLGPADSELLTFWISQEEKLTGSLINFGCHATTLTGNNWLFSADFPGYIASTLKNTEDTEFVPIFFNGCCGDVTQVNYKVGFIDTYEECIRIGQVLGKAALETKPVAQQVLGNKINVSREFVPVKRIQITEEQYKWSQQIMRKVDKEGMPPIQKDGIPDEQFAKQWIELYKEQNIIDSLEVMVISIGDAAFVGLPGEMFSEFGIRIKKQSPFKNTCVIELANDARKYFPTKNSFIQGPEGFIPMITGYETTPGASLYDPGSGEKLVESALNQLNKIYYSNTH